MIRAIQIGISKGEMKMKLLATAATVAVITACTANVDNSTKTGVEPAKEMAGVRITNDSELAVLIGKKLTIKNDYAVINADGTLSGSFKNLPIEGTWVMSDGYWCRTLTKASEHALKIPTDCQLFMLDGNNLNATRNKGNGKSFTYVVED